MKFLTERFLVMHTKHDCEKSQERESGKTEITWELSFLLVPSTGYKNITGNTPDSHLFKETCENKTST